MFGGDASDDEDSRSIAPSIQHRQSISDEAQLSTRSSVMSMRELEFGWSTNASGLRRGGSPLASPTFAAPPTRQAYRPPFAPTVDPFAGEEALESVAELPRESNLAPPVQLRRGRSLKDRVTDAIRGRSKSMSAGSRPTPPIASPPLDTKWLAEAEKISPRPEPIHRKSDPEKTSWAADIVRRVSRRRTTTAPRRQPDGDLSQYRAMQASRLSRIDINSNPDVANIRLYAAPPSANVPNAPALSSYAPRPPLRPRAQTDETVLTRSLTVAEASADYRARRAKTLHHKPMPTAPSSPVRSRPTSGSSPLASPDGTVTSRRASRRPRVVPEGWSTREDVAEEPEKERADELQSIELMSLESKPDVKADEPAPTTTTPLAPEAVVASA